MNVSKNILRNDDKPFLFSECLGFANLPTLQMQLQPLTRTKFTKLKVKQGAYRQA